MNDDELTTLLQTALTTTDAEKARLAADFARRKAEEDALLWNVMLTVLRRSQESVAALRSRAQTAAYAAYVKG